MLCLSRREGEQILIGDNIRLTVVRIGNQVKLGIEAPKEMNIRRAELPPKPREVQPCPQH